MPLRRSHWRLDGSNLRIEIPLAREHVRQTLQAIFKHNFKTDLSQHANAQRPGFAMGHEPGLLVCSWPRGGKPTLSLMYSDEVFTGIEYRWPRTSLRKVSLRKD